MQSSCKASVALVALVCSSFMAWFAAPSRAQDTGEIAAWGRNANGQCNVPAPNSGFVAVASGSEHSLGLKAHYGDLNCDGVVNFADINAFVLALSNPTGYHQQYPACHILNADINGDGVVNFADINPFVALLSH